MQDNENPFAGQGPVLLDIGGDVGALVVRMPATTIGTEVEIRPAGHEHHAGSTGHDTADHPHHPHVAVVARATSAGIVPCLVYPEVLHGDYVLHPLPDTGQTLSVTVAAGEVTEVDWPLGGAL